LSALLVSKPILFVVLDGVGDLPTKERGNQTPLEAASTPILDGLAMRGKMGMVYTVKRGVAPESDAGVFSLLSYDPSRLNLSRGVVEAFGAGISFQTGDLALRCNFATVEQGQIVDRRAGRNVSTEEATQLVAAIDRDKILHGLADFELKATIGHRCAIVFRGGRRKLSAAISNLDPAYERKGNLTVARTDIKLPTPIPHCVPLENTEESRETSDLVNQFAARVYDVLKNEQVNSSRCARGDRPANFLLMRDAGSRTPEVETLKQKFGFKGVVVADMPVELGIARVVGIDTQVFPPDRSLEAYSDRAAQAKKLLVTYDFVYVHLKGPDEPGHDGDFEGKVKAIEDIDTGFFSKLGELEGVVLCVTADHSTPCAAKGHTDDPVPILLVGPGITSDGSRRFTEAFGKGGALGTIEHGYEIMNILKKQSNPES
jgi:2,3-bisphosphoglycerate-independent phosphoglycerate mutase